jgi:HJR/Mrr/RecB family endonuclease
MTNYFVFRTDDSSKEWAWQEIQAGRLRQGWGLSKMRLPQSQSPSQEQIGEWCLRYRKQGSNVWGAEISADDAAKRYNILAAMLSVEAGDILIIPKMPSWESFCILEAAGVYEFDAVPRDGPVDDDFRHIIPVNRGKQKVVSRHANGDAAIVAASFRAYQKALNNVRKEDVVHAVQRLLLSEGVDTAKPRTKQFDEIVDDAATKSLLNAVMDKVSSRNPIEFEQMIEIMLERGGYKVVERHRYDRLGGDADIIAMPQLPPMAAVFEHEAPLLVQVKKKTGIDYEDTRAVDQLVQIADQYPGAALVVISSADSFTEGCHAKAQQNNVQLISRGTLARLLLKHLL